eukprot:TRINITY_DN26614_c0_g1_i1.p1 TRINITY_DN26614_c0_g1~~TRINITY_DN26614_c0_g1_i1.p1  ORF type:complete len:267 (+),score=42.26 TRINITY_DN26614_c0_g1_i1:116-802(+)
MVGFDVKGGRAVPRFEGLVVCKEHEEIIQDAYAAAEEMREEKILRKREDAALSRWRLLLRAIATRQRLRDAYQGTASPLGGASLSSSLREGRQTSETVILATVEKMDIEEMQTPGDGPETAPTALGEADGEGSVGVHKGSNYLSKALMSQGLAGTAGNLERNEPARGGGNVVRGPIPSEGSVGALAENESATEHLEHDFPLQMQSFDEETGIRTLRCRCGFVTTVEEL